MKNPPSSHHLPTPTLSLEEPRSWSCAPVLPSSGCPPLSQDQAAPSHHSGPGFGAPCSPTPALHPGGWVAPLTGLGAGGIQEQQQQQRWAPVASGRPWPTWAVSPAARCLGLASARSRWLRDGRHRQPRTHTCTCREWTPAPGAHAYEAWRPPCPGPQLKEHRANCTRSKGVRPGPACFSAPGRALSPEKGRSRGSAQTSRATGGLASPLACPQGSQESEDLL